jgi:hypothetical protein
MAQTLLDASGHTLRKLFKIDCCEITFIGFAVTVKPRGQLVPATPKCFM